MPLTPTQNDINQTDFTGGWWQDVETIGIPPEGLIDVKNLFPDPAGSLVTRKGFKRLFNDAIFDGYRIMTLNGFSRVKSDNTQEDYLMVVATNRAEAVNNVIVVAILLSVDSDDEFNGTIEKVSPNIEWNNSTARHWGSTIDGKYYGGGEGDAMYRWDPDPAPVGTFTTDVGVPNYPTWVTTTPGPNEKAHDFAYEEGDSVTLSFTKEGENYTKAFSAKKDIRYKKWQAGDNSVQVIKVTGKPSGGNFKLKYDGDVTGNIAHNASANDLETALEALSGLGASDVAVSKNGNEYTVTLSNSDPSKIKKADNDLTGGDDPNLDFDVKSVVKYDKGEHVSLSVEGYWKSYKCIEKHESTSDAPQKPPGKKWKKITLDSPVDDDGFLNKKDWEEVADAPITNVAVWHGNRLFARHDKAGKQMLIWSAVSTLPKAGETKWIPSDWRIRALKKEISAGFQPYETKNGDDIAALVSFGYYLLVFKRRSTHVIAGFDPNNWTPRELGPQGCIGLRAVCEHEGAIYFVGDEGFFQTNGTEIAYVPGSEKINTFLSNAIAKGIQPHDVILWSQGEFVMISLPTDGGNDPTRVIAYHSPTSSFYKLDMEVQDVAIQQLKGIDQVFFAQPTQVGDKVNAAYDFGTITSGGVFNVDNSGTRKDRAKRQSRRTNTPDGTEVNIFKNSSFEADNVWDFPSVWDQTAPVKVKGNTTVKTARRHKRGLLLTNKRHKNSTAGAHNGYEGIKQTVFDWDSGNHQISVYARLPYWEKHPKRKPDVKLFVDNNTIGPNDATYKAIYQGRGWWRISGSYTGNAGTARTHGILIGPGKTIELDQAFAHPAASDKDYFDGFGGEEASSGAQGGDRGLVMWYGHPNAENEDDTAQRTLEMQPVGWSMQTAWFTFSSAREERRIRTIQALVRAEDTPINIRVYINYQLQPENTEQTKIPDGDFPAVYFEGLLPETDVYAVSFEVAGLEGPAAIMGISGMTQFRRINFGS